MPPEEEAPTNNEFEQDSHASDAEQDVEQESDDDDDDYDDYDEGPQPAKTSPLAVKKPKAGKPLHDDVQRARNNAMRSMGHKMAVILSSRSRTRTIFFNVL